MARKSKKITVTDVTMGPVFKHNVVVHLSNGRTLEFGAYFERNDGYKKPTRIHAIHFHDTGPVRRPLAHLVVNCMDPLDEKTELTIRWLLYKRAIRTRGIARSIPKLLHLTGAYLTGLRARRRRIQMSAKFSISLEIYDEGVTPRGIAELLRLAHEYLATNNQLEISWRKPLLENLTRITPLLAANDRQYLGEPLRRTRFFDEED